MTTSPAPGTGSGTSRTSSTSGPPGLSMTTARTLPPPNLSAEGVGFEPTRTLTRPNGFQDRRPRPLGEPSADNDSGAVPEAGPGRCASRLAYERRPHAPAVRLDRRANAVAVRPGSYSARVAVCGSVPVGNCAGGQAASCPAMAGMADEPVPGWAGRDCDWDRERRWHLRRRPVLGSHGATPDTDHGGATATDSGPAHYPAAACKPQPCAHVD